MTPTQHLEQQQALVKQLAEILEFVMKFDESKVHGQLFLVLWLPFVRILFYISSYIM